MAQNYWQDNNLNLYYKSSTDYSIDEFGAKKYNKKANVTGNFVFDLQQDLIAANYLGGSADGSFGAKTKRAVLRFQRRAKTSIYRVKSGSSPADVASITYSGAVDGVCRADTAKELRLWISKKLQAPIGRFPARAIKGGKLRSDIAGLWTTLVQKVNTLGGTIDGPYGDTLRSISFRKSTGGNSLYSLHYTGRAIDLNQGLAGGKGQRYYVVKDPVGNDMFWRIYCKTADQKGKQGKKINKAKKIKYYSFWAKKEVDLPEAYYLDLTKVLDTAGFIRIRAHSNWKTNAKGTEWWHFHYDKNIATTFQDEVELMGHDEKKLRASGWSSDARLDHKPG